jgi:hypothetical protein
LPPDNEAAPGSRVVSLLRLDLVSAGTASTPVEWSRAWSAKLSFSSLHILALHAKRHEFWFRAVDPSEAPEAADAGSLSQRGLGSLYRFDMSVEQAERIASPARYEALVYANPGSTQAQERILAADASRGLILELLRQSDSWASNELRLEIPAGTTLTDLFSLPGGIAVLWSNQDPGAPAKLGIHRWQEGRLSAASAQLIDLDSPSAELEPLSHPSLLLLRQKRDASELSFAIFDADREQLFFLPAPHSSSTLSSGSNVSGGQN